MNIRLDVYHHLGAPPVSAADVSAAVMPLLEEIHQMTVNIDALVARVQQNSSAVDSALEVIRSLREQIQAAGTDETKLQQLVDQLQADDTRLAAAVAAGTPAAPAADTGAQSSDATGTATVAGGAADTSSASSSTSPAGPTPGPSATTDTGPQSTT